MAGRDALGHERVQLGREVRRVEVLEGLREAHLGDDVGGQGGVELPEVDGRAGAAGLADARAQMVDLGLDQGRQAPDRGLGDVLRNSAAAPAVQAVRNRAECR